MLIPVLLFGNRSHLEERKRVVVSTLRYIQQLKSEIQANTEWLDCRTQKRRYLFLSELRSMYEHELKQTLENLDIVAIGDDEQSR